MPATNSSHHGSQSGCRSSFTLHLHKSGSRDCSFRIKVGLRVQGALFSFWHFEVISSNVSGVSVLCPIQWIISTTGPVTFC